MNTTILVPLDGSPLAEQALPWAAEIARRSGAELRIVRVHLPPVAIAAEGFVAIDPVAEDTVLRDAEADYFRGLLDRVKAGCPGVTVTTATIDLDPDGDVADTLARYAAGTGAGLVVMSTHGRGPFVRFWLGSVADEFVRHATVPTLLLRPHDDGPVDLTRRPTVREVLVPLDGSALAERVIPPAARLGRLLGGEFTAMMVLETGRGGKVATGLEPRAPDGRDPRPAAHRAKEYLDRVARDFSRDHGAAVRTRLETHGSAAATILHYAQTHPDTLVALATHGRGGVTRLLLGSVADKVIRAAAGPVLVYRPGDGQ